jgi:hypothetical protein
MEEAGGHDIQSVEAREHAAKALPSPKQPFNRMSLAGHGL